MATCQVIFEARNRPAQRGIADGRCLRASRTVKKGAPCHRTDDSVDGKTARKLEGLHRCDCFRSTDSVDRAGIEAEVTQAGLDVTHRGEIVGRRGGRTGRLNAINQAKWSCPVSADRIGCLISDDGVGFELDG